MTENRRKYFPHDDDAMFDAKIVKMRSKLGLAGYGAYWAVVETLRRADNFRYEADYDVLACICGETAELFRSLIEDFDLFEIEEVDGVPCFYSPSLDRRMNRMTEAAEKRSASARTAAYARWQKHSDDNAEAMRPHSEGNAPAMRIDAKHNITKHNITKQTKEISTEPSRDASMQEPVFIKLPLNDGTEHPVTEKDLKRYVELYPAVDVKQDLRNMVGWLEANPSKRKTSKGVRRFITNWLARSQDSGGSKGNGRSALPSRGNVIGDNRYFLPEEEQKRLDTFVSEDVAKKQDAYRQWLQPYVKAKEGALGRKLNKAEEKEIIHQYADEFIAFYEGQQNGGQA